MSLSQGGVAGCQEHLAAGTPERRWPCAFFAGDSTAKPSKGVAAVILQAEAVFFPEAEITVPSICSSSSSFRSGSRGSQPSSVPFLLPLFYGRSIKTPGPTSVQQKFGSTCSVDKPRARLAYRLRLRRLLCAGLSQGKGRRGAENLDRLGKRKHWHLGDEKDGFTS